VGARVAVGAGVSVGATVDGSAVGVYEGSLEGLAVEGARVWPTLDGASVGASEGDVVTPRNVGRSVGERLGA